MIAPYTATRAWWMRVWIYGRQQTLILLSLIILIHLGVWGIPNSYAEGFLIASAIACIWCLIEIFPYFPFARKELATATIGQSRHTVSVLLLNVLQENDQYTQAFERISEADADIVLLSEASQAWADALSPLNETYPHTYLLPLEEHNGLLFYSRYPVDNVDLEYLCQSYIPSLFIDLRLADDCALRIYAIHPRPPRPEDDVEDLDDELIIVAKDARKQTCPVLVMGDFNEVGWSPAIRRFQEVSGLLDPKRGRGIYNSYSAKNPLMRWPLDHVFASDEFSVAGIERLTPCGSDHFPVKYTLVLEDEK
jgi:endonuclease/exonuclease/phosphatase (EEP) superfamily protein YafD